MNHFHTILLPKCRCSKILKCYENKLARSEGQKVPFDMRDAKRNWCISLAQGQDMVQVLCGKYIRTHDDYDLTCSGGCSAVL